MLCRAAPRSLTSYEKVQARLFAKSLQKASDTTEFTACFVSVAPRHAVEGRHGVEAFQG
jgi:hypothetical protein